MHAVVYIFRYLVIKSLRGRLSCCYNIWDGGDVTRCLCLLMSGSFCPLFKDKLAVCQACSGMFRARESPPPPPPMGAAAQPPSWTARRNQANVVLAWFDKLLSTWNSNCLSPSSSLLSAGSCLYVKEGRSHGNRWSSILITDCSTAPLGSRGKYPIVSLNGSWLNLILIAWNE